MLPLAHVPSCVERLGPIAQPAVGLASGERLRILLWQNSQARGLAARFDPSRRKPTPSPTVPWPFVQVQARLTPSSGVAAAVSWTASRDSVSGDVYGNFVVALKPGRGSSPHPWNKIPWLRRRSSAGGG